MKAVSLMSFDTPPLSQDALASVMCTLAAISQTVRMSDHEIASQVLISQVAGWAVCKVKRADHGHCSQPYPLSQISLFIPQSSGSC